MQFNLIFRNWLRNLPPAYDFDFNENCLASFWDRSEFMVQVKLTQSIQEAERSVDSLEKSPKNVHFRRFWRN